MCIRDSYVASPSETRTTEVWNANRDALLSILGTAQIGRKSVSQQAAIDAAKAQYTGAYDQVYACLLYTSGMCLAQLKRMTHLREKKGAYHAVRGHCEELGVWFGALAGLLLPVIVPGLWYAGLALAIVEKLRLVVETQRSPAAKMPM